MDHSHNNDVLQQRLLGRFWKSASGFWKGPAAWRAWLLCALLLAIGIAQLLTQYWLNYWNRDFFNALELRDRATLVREIMLFFPLAALGVVLAIFSVWGRMTTQRLWRKYLTTYIINEWLADNHYRFLDHLNGVVNPQNPEYRIAEDSRVATDVPVDLVLALCLSVLTAGVFFGILASVGGSLTIELAGMNFTIPAYLAVGVLAYSGAVTTAILLIGRRFTSVVQDQVQSEAAFRASANLIRESGEGIVVNENETKEVRELWSSFYNVIDQWQKLCWQHMRITLVSNGNILLAPVVGLMLCAPKYLSGAMSLGEVTQAAAAFVTVQSAFNWFVDNFSRMADWKSAANRVAILLLALDGLKEYEQQPRSQLGPGNAAFLRANTSQ
jgi:ABC-type uncharacterized transport system fused permease/ATPase subunit